MPGALAASAAQHLTRRASDDGTAGRGVEGHSGSSVLGGTVIAECLAQKKVDRLHAQGPGLVV
jgi:hypothetical protein